MVIAADISSEEVDKSVWVYDRGSWAKNKELCWTIRCASREDVILEESMKVPMMKDVLAFFKAKETYLDIGATWRVSHFKHTLILVKIVC